MASVLLVRRVQLCGRVRGGQILLQLSSIGELSASIQAEEAALEADRAPRSLEELQEAWAGGGASRVSAMQTCTTHTRTETQGMETNTKTQSLTHKNWRMDGHIHIFTLRAHAHTRMNSFSSHAWLGPESTQKVPRPLVDAVRIGLILIY